MNCFNQPYSDMTGYGRPGSMYDMSAWSSGAGCQPCGMPPSVIEPRRESSFIRREMSGGRTSGMRPQVSAPNEMVMPDQMAMPNQMSAEPQTQTSRPNQMSAEPQTQTSMTNQMPMTPQASTANQMPMTPQISMPNQMPMTPQVSMANQMPLQPQVSLPSPEPEQNRFPVGMAYVPMQKWSQPSAIDAGFKRGTIFPELDLPFVMGRCM